MKKSLYICNAENLQREAIHTLSTTNCVPSSSTSASRSCGFSAKNIRRVRSLFAQNAKLVTTMLKTNKQATTAKHSNRYAIDILIVISTIVISTLLLIYAPEALYTLGEILGVIVLVALAVVPMIQLAIETYEK